MVQRHILKSAYRLKPAEQPPAGRRALVPYVLPPDTRHTRASAEPALREA